MQSVKVSVRMQPLGLAALAFAIFLAGCSSTPGPSDSRYLMDQDRAPTGNFDVSALNDAVPRFEAPRRAGNKSPYEVWGTTYRVLDSNQDYVERGVASWYGEKFHGHSTSNGETFNMYAMTAAHKSLRIPSYARVTNLDNGRSVIVRVNDRGPFHGDRLIDLSYAAAKKLGYQSRGTARVEVAAITVDQDGAMSIAGEPWPGPSAGTKGNEKGHFVQIASFSSPSPAEQLLARVQTATEDPVRVRAITTGGGRFHRVQVGPFASEGDAREAQGRLQRLGFSQSILLTDMH